MVRARIVLAVGVLVTTLVAPAGAATTRTVAVDGAVAAPATYSLAQLAALPQTTYPHGVTGVGLESLVQRSAPTLPAGKNTQLRVILTVTGRDHRAESFALGELDPDFGNQAAALTVGRTVDLVVIGDRARDIRDVTEIRVAVSDAAARTAAPGSVVVVTPHRTVTLPAALLARLPRRTVTVTFLAGTASQTHTESGPPLSLALLAAGVLQRTVVAVGSDGYGAAVTLNENRPLLLSMVEDGAKLAQPRLIADGDVKGGRYVSNVVVLQVS